MLAIAGRARSPASAQLLSRCLESSFVGSENHRAERSRVIWLRSLSAINGTSLADALSHDSHSIVLLERNESFGRETCHEVLTYIVFL